MNTQMGSSLPSEKLDCSNYSFWEYKLTQTLVGQGYWSYINDALENKPNITNANYPMWDQGASRVMYCLATCVHDHMLNHIRDANTPKEAWENLKKIFAANTTARKIQLRQELNNIRQKDMSMSDYTAKIKSICDSLGSININVNGDKMVQVCLGRPHTTIRPIKDGNLGERKPSFVLRPPIDVIGRRKPRPNQKQGTGRTNVLLKFEQ